jgi:hypothetical protein
MYNEIYTEVVSIPGLLLKVLVESLHPSLFNGCDLATKFGSACVVGGLRGALPGAVRSYRCDGSLNENLLRRLYAP